MAFNFLKTGSASTHLATQDKVEAETRKEQNAKTFRFFLKEGESAKITMVDGDLNAEGFLIPARWYEHNLFLNGKYGNIFVCPAKTMPELGGLCCICDSGDRPTLQAGFTIIDHRTFSSADGKKTYKDTRKFLPAPPRVFEILNKIALTVGGLAGVTFDVSRTNEKAPRVGDVWVPLGKTGLTELQSKYIEEVTDPKTNTKTQKSYFFPLDYEKELIFKTNDELLMLGLGPVKPGITTGMSSPAGSMAQSGSTPQGMQPLPNYAAQL